MKFTLHITLGNDAMQTGKDVAEALRAQANLITHHFPDTEISRITAKHQINDDNGKKVGFWEVTK